MVQLMKSGVLRTEPETCTEKLLVKVEIEDSLEEEHGPLSKRSKPTPAVNEVFLFLFFRISNCLVPEKLS